jgi:hypothetical protein
MNAETKRMIETTDWDALAERAENTTYDISEMRPVPPEEDRETRAAAGALRRRLELERLRGEIDGLQVEVQSEVDSLQVEVQAKTDSLRARIDDLAMAK